ncbi:hypothetical protein LJR034_003003 [Caballeronia sp. LjRoot34]|uniref:hypothetical protein n=1 Tax=Caballeronia sp. LjRoot34 TaxID=3342325 RepID=UPI003ECFC8F1
MLAANTAGRAPQVTGNLALNVGATYAVIANADGTNSLTDVIGNPSLASSSANGGATVVVTAGSGQARYKPQTTYKILTYTGLLSGAFAGVSIDFVYLTPSLSYAPNEVDLTLNITSLFYQTGQFAGFGLVGGNRNQFAVARALNGILAAGGNAVTAQLLTDSRSGAQSALSQMAGDGVANLLSVARQNTDAMTLKRFLVDRASWTPLEPAGWQRNGPTVTVRFRVPVPPLKRDVTQVAGNRDYWFSLRTPSGERLPIRSVFVLGAGSVLIVAQDPVPEGTRLEYTFDGTGKAGSRYGPRGNLRDSQGDGIRFDNGHESTRLDNWCVIFEVTL